MPNSIRAVKALKAIRGNLRLEKNTLKAIQTRKLRALVDHAYARVPYYRGLFDAAGMKPGDVRGSADLLHLPTTSKLKLQSLPQSEILAQDLRTEDCREDVTSGSTGIPLKVYFSKEDHMVRSLLFLRTFMESGYTLRHRQAIVCDTRFVTHKQYWFQYLGVFRKKYIPVQLSVDEQIDLLRSYRPDFIHGYPASIAAIATKLLDQSIHDIRPSMVCTGAELLGPRRRHVINEAFGVELADTYASIESGMIAWQCRARRDYHVNQDCLVVEILRDGRPAMPGETGRVVVTNLHSYAMPIIRYELGDVCVPSESDCPCGCHLPTIRVVEGRIDDMIYTPSGRVISPNSITNAMEAIEGVGQFRVIQETAKELVVQIVPGKDYDATTRAQTMTLLGDLVGNEMSVELAVLEEIPAEHTGKIRAVISKLRGEPNTQAAF